MTYSDSTKTTFKYNGAGERLRKQDSGGTIKYVYDMDKVVLERDAQDTTVAGYTHEGGGLYYDLISMKRTNSYYCLFDGLGSATEVVDSSENTQNSCRYEAFGESLVSSGTRVNNLRFVGNLGHHKEGGRRDRGANAESNSIDFKECACQMMTDTIDVGLT